MDTTQLRYEMMRDLYRTQRARRDEIRGRVATPVAALAFSVFNLSTLASEYSLAAGLDWAGIVIAVLGVLCVLALLLAALLIVGVEWNVVYMDPPDLEGMIDAEQRLRAATPGNDAQVALHMQELLTSAYDIVYRRYLAANEKASRARTLGLRLILFALGLLAVAFLFLPLQGGPG